MGTVIWQGDAPTVAQVSDGSIDSLDGTPANNTFTVTIGGLSISQVGTGTAAATAAALVVLLNASTDKRFSTITWSVPSGSTIRGTADIAGIPFTAALTETGAGTGAVTDFSATTANAGPNDWSTASNWDTGVVPVDNDDVIIENSAVSILYGLAQSSIDLTSLTIQSTFTGTIGLPRTNADGYVEYRPTYLQIGSALSSITGSGSGRIKIDNGTDQGAVYIYGSGTRAETGIPSILLLGSHASQAVTINKGDVGIGFFGGETAVVAALNVGYMSQQASDSKLAIGSGVTLTALTINGGVTTCNSAATTIVQEAGTLTIGEDATATTLTVRGGTCYYNSSGTTTTGNAVGGVLDFRQDSRGRTFTNANVYKGATIYDPMASVTWTNGLDLQQTGLEAVTLQLGPHRTWTPSAI